MDVLTLSPRIALRSAASATLGVALTLGMATQALAEAGRVNFAYGDVRIVSQDGSETRASRGATVDEGDTVRTGRRSAAQIRMVDGAALAVRANTEVEITEYRYNESASEDRSFLSLVRGTFRAITGLIGRGNRDNYRVRTPTATIGIRGSDGDFGFNPDTGLAAVRTNVGGHEMSTDVPGGTGDTIATNPGQIATALPGQAPVFSDVFPFEVPIRVARARRAAGLGGATAGNEGDGEGNQDGTADGDNGEGQGGQGPGGEGRGGEGPGGEGPGGEGPGGEGEFAFDAFDGEGFDDDEGLGDLGEFDFVELDELESFLESIGALDALELAEDEFERNGGDDGAAALPVGFVAVGAFIEVGAANPIPSVGSVAVGEGIGTIEINAFGEVVALLDDDGNGVFEFESDQGPLGFSADTVVLDASGNEAAFVVFGYWGPGFSVTENGSPVPTSGDFHFALADNLTATSTLQNLAGVGFSYFFIDGAATNETGADANFYDANLTGVFANDATLGTLSVNIQADFPVGSTNWSLGGGGTVADFIANDGLQLTGVCCFGAVPIPAAGQVTGRFVGDNAEGVVGGFSAEAGGTGANQVSGTFVVER